MFFRHEKMRPNQDTLIEDMNFVLKNKLTGLFEAPTGLGKTDAALASVLDFCIENKKKLFFVTTKNTQHKIVIEAIIDINKKYNIDMRVVDLVAKSNFCIDPFLSGLGSEFYDLCEKKIKKQACFPHLNATGKSTQKNKSIDLFLKEYKSAMHSSELREMCLDFDLCPYVVSLLLAKSAQVIVCDANHIFVNKIRSALFGIIGISLDDCVFVFDEAHNLPHRLRSILSDSLSLKQINFARKEYEKCPKEEFDLTDFLETLEYLFVKQKDGFLSDDYFDKLFYDEQVLAALLSADGFILENEKKNSNLHRIANFILSWQTDKQVKTKFKTKDTIYIKGLDPSFLSRLIFQQSSGNILMSATFSPMQMYSDILGIPNPYIRQYGSPFPKENKLTMYFDNVTTKYEERAESLPLIADLIKEKINKVSGNIAVFFPSYDVLESIYLRMSENTIKKIFVQGKNMTANETKRLIDNFKKNKVGFGSVLFAVVGGSFSEGVDYPGDDLIGIIMVGFPFPEPDYEIEALIKFYDSQDKVGWNYAYLYPTVAKVVQACGRGIRSETDKAFVLLLDKRFGWTKYKSLFPTDYNLLKYDNKKFSEFVSKM